MSGHEQQYIDQAFATNWIAPLGPNVDAFEREMAEYLGVTGTAAVSSGTAALHLAVRLLGVKPGDEVFCSSLTFIASTNPIVYQGGTPVFIDSDPESWNMSPQALQRAFDDRIRSGKLPKAVVIVNLFGQSANYEALKAICDLYRVPIIEDAAESLGAVYQGKASGTLGKIGILSFNGNKIITTSGGGMLVSDDFESLEKARFLSTQARDSSRHYQHSETGYNYRMSNILAGIGRGQLTVLDERVKTRRAIFARYRAELSAIPGIEFMPEIGEESSTHWLSVLTIDPAVAAISTFDVMDKLAAENIESRPIWKPMHRQPLFRECAYYSHEENASVSDRLFLHGLCLPSGSSLSEQDQTRIIRTMKDILQK
jgi:pyridoxal phosphate-dependent aminotransferase EpsN